MTTTAEMSPTDRPKVFVHLLPSLIPPGSLRGGVAVVVDVLRATTVMVHALANGCEAVIPCAEIEEAAGEWPPVCRSGTAILGGERGGLPIPGFDLGNSPGDYTFEVCEGKTLVMTTTNGTRAILASLEAERVYIASFANLEGDRRRADRPVPQEGPRTPDPHRVLGHGGLHQPGRFAAGRRLDEATRRCDGPRLSGGRTPRQRRGSRSCCLSGWRWSGILEQRPFWKLLQMGRGGRNVTRIGLEKDIKIAAKVDRFPIIAELTREPLRIVKV